MVPAIKHVCGCVLLWGGVSAGGVGELLFPDGVMNSQLCCEMLKEKMVPSLCALGGWALI